MFVTRNDYKAKGMHCKPQFQSLKREEDLQSLAKDRSASIPRAQIASAMQKLGKIFKKNEQDNTKIPVLLKFNF